MMRSLRLARCAAVVLATAGIVAPIPHVRGDEQTANNRPVVKVAAANAILDVKLSKEGDLTGRVIDHGGAPVIGASVTVKRGAHKIAEATTDESGNFAVPNLKSGLYAVNSGLTGGSYRIWTDHAAPKSAMPHALLVLGENGARGQYGLSQTIAGENLGLILLCATTGLALAALVVAIHAENIADAASSASP